MTVKELLDILVHTDTKMLVSVKYYSDDYEHCELLDSSQIVFVDDNKIIFDMTLEPKHQGISSLFKDFLRR